MVTDATLDRRQLVAQQVAWTHAPYKRKKIIIALLVIDGTNDFYLVGRGEACFSRDIGHRRVSVRVFLINGIYPISLAFFKKEWYNVISTYGGMICTHALTLK